MKDERDLVRTKNLSCLEEKRKGGKKGGWVYLTTRGAGTISRGYVKKRGETCRPLVKEKRTRRYDAEIEKFVIILEIGKGKIYRLSRRSRKEKEIEE